MLPYWLLFTVLAIGSVAYTYTSQQVQGGQILINRRVRDDLPLAIVLLAITLMIGLRYRVGGDWNVYLVTFRSVSSRELGQALQTTPDEAAYTLINWLVAQAGLGFWAVNLICAIPFVLGLTAISRQQPNPWLALLVAAPQLVIVVAMGYTRQAAAVGFMLIGIAGLARGRSFLWFVTWTLVATAFHTSAIAFIPIMAAFQFRATLFWFVLVIIVLIVGYYFILPLIIDRYSVGYIQNIYEAKGAIFRILPNAIAGIMLLLFRKNFEAPTPQLRIWRSMSWISIILLLAFFEIRSSVISDRTSLYILPLQVFVLSRVPTAFSSDAMARAFLTVLVIFFSATVLILWLSYANNARYWLPYQLYPLG